MLMTLLLVKLADIPHIHNLFNKSDKNLRFIVDRFENDVPHFLDIKMSILGLTVYRKNTHTSQYINFERYTPWNYKISWTGSLIARAKHLCSADLLPAEIQNIKKFAPWNRYPVLRNLKEISGSPGKIFVTSNTTKLSFFTKRSHYKASIFFCGLSFSLPRMSSRLYWKNRENTLGKD